MAKKKAVTAKPKKAEQTLKNYIPVKVEAREMLGAVIGELKALSGQENEKALRKAEQALNWLEIRDKNAK